MALNPAFSFVHVQETEASSWTIPHGLNCKPSVSVQVLYSGQMTAIIPNSISYTDNNTVVVGFTTAFSGTARLF